MGGCEPSRDPEQSPLAPLLAQSRQEQGGELPDFLSPADSMQRSLGVHWGWGAGGGPASQALALLAPPLKLGCRFLTEPHRTNVFLGGTFSFPNSPLVPRKRTKRPACERRRVTTFHECSVVLPVCKSIPRRGLRVLSAPPQPARPRSLPHTVPVCPPVPPAPLPPRSPLYWGCLPDVDGFHPSSPTLFNTNTEFIEVVKRSVDNLDNVFLISTAVGRRGSHGPCATKRQRLPAFFCLPREGGREGGLPSADH